MLDAAEPADPDLLQDEQDLLEIFADITELSRRVPEDPEDEHARSDQEYFLTYLAFLDPERSGVPDQFLAELRKSPRALRRDVAGPDARARAGVAAHVPVARAAADRCPGGHGNS